MPCLLRLLRVFEERVMQDLIIDVDLAHFRLQALTHFLLQSLTLVSFSALFPQLSDACRLNEVRQFEWDLVNTTFVLQIPPLLRPMTRNGH